MIILAPTSSYLSEIQESDSQHSEFVFLAVDIITYNDNLTEVVID